LSSLITRPHPEIRSGTQGDAASVANSRRRIINNAPFHRFAGALRIRQHPIIPGAAGSIAGGRVARATADGYTLSFRQWATHVVNGALYSLPYVQEECALHKKRTRNRAKSAAKMAVHRSGAQANNKIVIVRGAFGHFSTSERSGHFRDCLKYLRSGGS
jgi:hypothetical protein